MRRDRVVAYLVFAMIFIMGIVTGQACEKMNHLPVQERSATDISFPETHCVTSCVKRCVRGDPGVNSL